MKGCVTILSVFTIYGTWLGIRSVSAQPDIETHHAVDTALGIGHAEVEQQKALNEYMFKQGNIIHHE